LPACSTPTSRPSSSSRSSSWAIGTWWGYEALSRFGLEPARSPDVWFAQGGRVGLGVELEVKAIATALDALHGLPDVAPTDRLDVVGADFFEDPLPTGDCYLLMNIVHDWADAEALAILTTVREAAATGATVLLVEAVLPTGADPMARWVFSLDVVMLALTGGRERTVADFDALLAKAGLTLQSVTATASPCSIIEATTT
jgi:hypothetical protein